MKHCDKCNVDVNGSRKICPLCQTVLTGTDEEELYPLIPTFFSKYKFAIKTAVFASISVCIISLAVNYMIPQSGNWSLFVLLGMLCLWISLFIIIKKRNNIPKTILYNVVIISLISVFWDKLTGWHGWSLDFVLPSLCVGAMIGIFVFIKIAKLRLQDYIFFIFTDAVLGIIPTVLYSANLVRIRYASIICTAVSIIAIVAMLIFQGRIVFFELRKKFHL